MPIMKARQSAKLPVQASPPSGTFTRPSQKSRSGSTYADRLNSTSRHYQSQLTEQFTKLQNLTCPESQEIGNYGSGENGSKISRKDTISRAIEFIEKLMEQNEELKSSLAKQEIKIRNLEKQRSSSINLSTFVESHTNASLSTRKCSPLSVPSTGLGEINAPAAMPGKNAAASIGPIVASDDTLQADKSWEEAITQLCMPKGALLPLAQKTSSEVQDASSDKIISSSEPESKQSTGTADSPGNIALSACSASGPTSSSFPTSSIDSTSTTFGSVLNVPDTTIPMLPLDLTASLMDNGLMSISSSGPSTIRTESIASSLMSRTHSNGTSSPTATLSSSRTSQMSLGRITPDSAQLVQNVGELSVDDHQSVFSLSAGSFSAGTLDLPKSAKSVAEHTTLVQYDIPTYLEQFSDVYSQGFPTLTDPTSSLHETFQPLLSGSKRRQSPASTNVLTPSIALANPSRRLSIVNIPRRITGSGSAGSPPDQDHQSGTSPESNAVFNMPTLPSLTNLRIHTSTIRGRRQQKKNNSAHAVAAAAPSASQEPLPTDNALGLALQLQPEIPSINATTRHFPTSSLPSANQSHALDRPSDKVDMSGVNVPGAPNFQPSAAASMMLQPLLPSHKPCYDYYGQSNPYARPTQNQMHNFQNYVYGHPQQTYFPLTPEEDFFKLPRTTLSSQASAIVGAANFGTPQNSVQNHRMYGAHLDAFKQSSQSISSNNIASQQAFGIDSVPRYPSSLSYSSQQQQLCTALAQQQHQQQQQQQQQHWNANMLYKMMNASRAHEQALSFANMPNYIHTTSHSSIAQTQLPSANLISANHGTTPRFANLSQPCFQNGTMGQTEVPPVHPFQQSSSLLVGRSKDESNDSASAQSTCPDAIRDDSEYHDQRPLKKIRVE